MIFILALLGSFSSFAFQAGIVTSAGVGLYATASVSQIIFGGGVNYKEEALMIVRDVEEYNLTGNLTSYLVQKVNLLMSEDSSISEADALDIISNEANSILKN